MDEAPSDDPAHHALARPLLSAAQASSDRLASELRALQGVIPEHAAGTLRESLRALHSALFQLHALNGTTPQAGPPRSRVDALGLACEVVEAARAEGLSVEIDARGPTCAIEAEAGALHRLLRWLLDRAASGSTAAVRLGLGSTKTAVSFEVPWSDELPEVVRAQERAWLERAVGALAGRVSFEGSRVRVLLPRAATLPAESTFEELTRELRDLRHERATRAHEVERASCALHSAQREAEALRRQLTHVEQRVAAAVDDLQKTFESLEAMAKLVSEPEGFGRELESVTHSGLGRVMELSIDLDTASLSTASSVSPTWSGPPASGVFAPPRDLLAILDAPMRAVGDDDPGSR